MLFAGPATDTFRGLSPGKGQLVVGGDDFPVVPGIAADFIVEFDVLGDGNVFRTMAHAIATAGT